MSTAEETGPNSAPFEEEEDDDPPSLSSRALEALREFLSEQNAARTGEDEGEAEVKLVAEDWRLSQFWYDRVTAETISEEIRSLSESTSSPVACIACPTLYAYLKKNEPNISVQLLEYDKRFEQYGSDFTFYDYNQPEELPLSLKHAFQVVVADPPYLICQGLIISVLWTWDQVQLLDGCSNVQVFDETVRLARSLGPLPLILSKECLEKVAQTISFLAHPQKSYLLLLTGEVQKDRAAELLDLHPCGFRPQHSNKLGNEFKLFTNYDPAERLGGWE